MQHSSALSGFSANICARLLEDVPSKRELRLHRCVAVTVPPRWGWKAPRLIDDYHLLYVLSGEGGYQSEGRSIAFAAGQVLFLGSGCRHSGWQNPRQPPSIISLRFGLYDRGPSRGRHRRAGNIALKNAARMFSWTPEDPSSRTVLASLLQQLHRHHQRSEAGSASACLQVILAMMAGQQDEESGATTGDQRIERVRQQLDLHPVRRASVDDMAMMAGLSRNYFVRLFSQQVGMSPKSYQIAARMRYARYLLEHSEASVRQVAEDLLFPDPFSFSKQYRRFHGHAPSRWAAPGN